METRFVAHVEALSVQDHYAAIIKYIKMTHKEELMK